MTAAQLIQSADFDGVRLALTAEGGLHYSGDPALIAEWLPILRENKSAIVAELHRERRLHEPAMELIAEPGVIATAETIPTVKAADLIYTLQLGGFVFSLVDDGIRVEPVSKLTLATKNLISENEAAVIAELRQQAVQDAPQCVRDVSMTPTQPATQIKKG